MKYFNPHDFTPKFLYILLFNLAERLHHRITDHEVAILKNSGLFKNVSEEEFNQIKQAFRLVRYPKDTLIFKEGDLAEALYIIVQGSVRVFTHDAQQRVIPLARLATGDFFGEQAVFGEGNKRRNASIATIEESTFMFIDGKSILPLWDKDHELKIRLKKIGHEQALRALTLATSFYNDIKPIIENIETKEILDLKDGEIIFNYGETPTYLYYILSGQVKLSFPSTTTNHPKIIQHTEGQLFGELPVIENKNRLSTASAVGDVKLMRISAVDFKARYQASTALKKLLLVLKHSYPLSNYSSVYQYIGEVRNIGTTITNIFKMGDGRIIVSSRPLNQDLFVMSLATKSEGKTYIHKVNTQQFIKLTLVDQRLIHIEVSGSWEDLGITCQRLLKHELIPEIQLQKFTESGRLTIDNDVALASPIVCACMSITKQKIKELMGQGHTSIDTIASMTGASTICGSCRYKVLELMGESPWLTARMRKDIKYSDHVQSYLVEPIDTCIAPYLPGQHVMVQAFVNGVWIERTYALTNLFEKDKPACLTIQKEPQGLFTQWLFTTAPDEFMINISQPEGTFLLSPDPETPALCFAGGIGINPFLTYAKGLARDHSSKKLHILYCVPTEADFVFRDELETLRQSLPNLTIDYHTIATNPPITAAAFTQLTNAFPNADIYVCGPVTFTEKVKEVLNTSGYAPNKIHLEEFVHVGTA